MPDILLTKRDRVAVVSLNRPEVRNAMTLKMWRELAAMFSGLAEDDDIRAVVLTSSGADFCVGADVSEFDRIRENRDQSAAYEVSVDACSAAIANLAKPVIAAISGYCLGGGCHLALACDFRFADDTAKLGIPSAKLSIVYGVKSVQRLLAIAGIANAKRMLYSGERYEAARARSMGLVDEICDDAVSRRGRICGNAGRQCAAVDCGREIHAQRAVDGRWRSRRRRGAAHDRRRRR